MMDVLAILAGTAVLVVLLAIGDRLGASVGCMILRRCKRTALLYLPGWLRLPAAITIPVMVIAGVFMTVLRVHRHNAAEAVVDNMELMLLAAFFVTGFIGGLFGRKKNL